MAELNESVNEMEEDNEIITLQDGEGNDVDFYHVATLDYKNEWYIFLQPVEPNEEIGEDEVLIYKLGTDEDGEDTFIPLESEEELNAVFNEYLKEADCECGDDCDCGDDCECGDDCDCGGDDSKCEDDCKCGCKA